MHVLLDVIVIAVVGVCLALGWRRGFIRSIKGLIGLLLAFILVLTLAQPLGEKIDEAVIRPWAVDRVVEMQGEEISADTPVGELDIVAVNERISELFQVDILGTDGLSPEMTVGEYVEKTMADSGISMGVSHAIATILLFIVGVVAAWLICLVLTPVLKLPVLRQCNGLLGLLIGLVNAVIILLVIATVVRLFGGTLPNVDLGAQTVERTFLFKYVDQINPIVHWIIK